MITFDEITETDGDFDLNPEPAGEGQLEFTDSYDDHPSETPADTYVGGNLEEEELKKYRSEQAKERLLNDTSDADLRKAMAMLMARLDEQDKVLRQIGRNFGGISLAGSDNGFDSMSKELSRQLKGKNKVKVLIHTSEHLNQNWNVPLRVNGNPPVGFESGVPRGKVVELPVAYVEVLQHAVINGWQKIVGPDNNPHDTLVYQLRYPFSILS